MRNRERLQAYARQTNVKLIIEARKDKTVPELQAECLQRGIEFRTKDTKTVLIDKLANADIMAARSKLTAKQQRRLRRKSANA